MSKVALKISPGGLPGDIWRRDSWFTAFTESCTSIASIILFFALVGTISSFTPEELEHVDPNTMSCDPHGQISLLLPHFTDCTRFYMCAHGIEVERYCPASLYFDFVLQTCNWPRDTKCYLRTHPDELEEGSGDEEFNFLFDKASDGIESALTADRVSNSVRPLSIEEPEKTPSFNIALKCSRADSASHHIPYKGDCQRFWRCVKGLPQVMFCNDGLYFNERTEQCDFEANVKCLDKHVDELNSEFIIYK